MAQVTISQLPAAQPLSGTESVPISQNGQTVQTTVAAIANSPTQQQTFITVNQEVTLPNSRRLQGGTGVGLTDTGALGSISITLNGASGSLESSTNGIIAKTSGSTVVGRTLTGSATGVAVSNGNGVGGNPVISLTGPVGTINGLGGSGLLALQNGTAVGAISIQGAASQIDVANGNGLLGSPTISIASNPTIPGTGGMVIPSGTTAERGPAINGTIRYNTDTSQFEIYDNGWGNLPAGAVSSVDVSGGATGLTTTGGPITSSGVITLGGTLLTSSGGTGLTTYAAGDLPYYASGTAFNKLAIGMAGQVLTSSGSAPQYVDQSTLVVGTATNIAGGAANRIPVNTGAGATSFIVAPTLGNTFLEWSGSAFQWSSNPLGTVTSVDVSGGTTGLTTSGGPVTSSGVITLAGTLNVANGGTGLTAYSVGDLIYASGSATLSKLGLGTLGQVLTAGASAPQYVNQSTLSVGSATTATNLAGGALGSLPYQSAAGTTLFVSGNTTTTPQFLTSTGTGAAAQAPTLTSSTGSGSVVLATSPTLVTPNLGTPSALVGTNITGTASGLSIGGNAATATTATNATNTAITANSANATNYLTFVSATTGNLGQLVNSSITCNPSTGAITGGIFGGVF